MKFWKKVKSSQVRKKDESCKVQLFLFIVPFVKHVIRSVLIDGNALFLSGLAQTAFWVIKISTIFKETFKHIKDFIKTQFLV